MRYQLEVYEDAHDADPVRAGQCDSAVDLLEAVVQEVKGLAVEEPRDCQFGPAGEDELFEMFPTHGHGTVVVREL